MESSNGFDGATTWPRVTDYAYSHKEVSGGDIKGASAFQSGTGVEMVKITAVVNSTKCSRQQAINALAGHNDVSRAIEIITSMSNKSIQPWSPEVVGEIDFPSVVKANLSVDAYCDVSLENNYGREDVRQNQLNN